MKTVFIRNHNKIVEGTAADIATFEVRKRHWKVKVVYLNCVPGRIKVPRAIRQDVVEDESDVLDWAASLGYYPPGGRMWPSS